MDSDQPFRIALIVGALMVFPVMAYHRIKSQATREPLDRWQEGPFILFTLRPLGIAAMLGLLAFMISPAWMAWSSMRLPEWLRWAGVGVGALAGGLLIWTVRTLGPNLTDTVVTRKAHTLVTTGPYRWVRHPFYDASGLAILANSLAAANWFLFVTGGLTFILMIVRTRREERQLLARFGDSYRAYVERTGAFLPRIGVVALGLLAAGMVCGAAAGAAALAIALVLTRDYGHLDEPRIFAVAATLGAMLGVAWTPLAGWLLLRGVPPRRIFCRLAVGAIAGGVAGWFIPRSFAHGDGALIAAAAGSLAAAMVLRLARTKEDWGRVSRWWPRLLARGAAEPHRH